jgi:hypothetical protein
VSRASYRANTPCRRASQSENSDRIHDFGCCGSAPRDAWLKIPEGVVENPNLMVHSPQKQDHIKLLTQE